MANVTIQIVAEDVSEGKFFFQEIGTGQYKGEDIRLIVSPPSHDPIIQYRGKKYKVGLAEFANAICDVVSADD